MQVLAKVMEVKTIWVREHIPEPEGKEEPRLIIEAVKDWGDWDFFLGEKGHQGFISNSIELDIDSEIGFEGLDIERISWIGNSMFVYFPCPTDIEIVDTEVLLDIPFEPLESPLSSIVISALSNFEPPLHKARSFHKNNQSN